VELQRFGRVKVNGRLFTSTNENIHAIGDVIGPPGLASAAVKQARIVVDGLFGDGGESGRGSGADKKRMYHAGCFLETPTTLWTVPEVASVGMTQETALATVEKNKAKEIIVVGYCFWKDIARGRLTDPKGYVKCTGRFSESSRAHKIVGWEIIGEGSNELIQTAAILLGETAERVSSTPFAAVTLGASLGLACDDMLAKSKHTERRTLKVGSK